MKDIESCDYTKKSNGEQKPNFKKFFNFCLEKDRETEIDFIF